MSPTDDNTSMSPISDPYAGIAPIYDRWCAEVTEDVGFYVAACADADGPVIEIGGGTGRIALALAAAGHDVIAVDRSAPMLDVLRRRAKAADLAERITVVEGDLRALPALPRTDRVIAPFRVLLHCADDEARLTFLRAVADLLRPGGLLVFDVFEPTREDVRETHDRWLERPSGVRERARWDERARRLDLDVAYRGYTTSMTLHWLPGARWAALCEEAGLVVVAGYAGFDGTPFTGQRGDSAWAVTRG
jgi:ubiquinone/menaquinone biosynthesis C-methylase UbiE